MWKTAARKISCGEKKKRNHTVATVNSEANRFIWISGSTGKRLKYLANCATINPAAILAQ